MMGIHAKKISYLLFSTVFSTILWAGFDCICPANEAGGAEIVDRIAAVVNDEIVSLYELRQAFRPYLARVKSLGYPAEREKAVLSKIRRDLLDQLIDKKLTGQEVKRLNISVGEEEVDSTFERIKSSRGYSDEEFRKALTEESLTIGEYREQLKEQLLRAKLINLEVKSKVVITDKDVQAYYDRHKDIYGAEKKYHLRNIILRVSETADEKEKRIVYNRIKKIQEKLQQGESFQRLAKNHSESTLADEGGDLGFFKLDELSPQLQKALANLAAGDYTPILDTDQGYQIFYVQEVKTIVGKTVEEASSEIEEKLYKEIVDRKFQSWIEALRNRSHIKILYYDE